MNEMLEAALQYAGRGWQILPLHAMRSGKCSCGRAGCRALPNTREFKGGCHAASADSQQVEKWWRKWPDANIGIATGAKSGLVVFDVDGQEGLLTIRRLLPLDGQLPNTAVAITSRGCQIYYTAKVFCDCSAGKG